MVQSVRKNSPNNTNPSLHIAPHQQIAAPGYHRVASNKKQFLLYQLQWSQQMPKDYLRPVGDPGSDLNDRMVLVLPEWLD